MATEIGRGIIPVTFDAAAIESGARAAILPGLSRVAGDVALLFVGKKLFDFGKSGLEDLKQAQQVTAQTEAQIRATGGAAGVTAKDIDELGHSMVTLAGFDDEAARSAANVLLRFGAIKGADTFKRVETDAADLAVTMGTDLPAAAQTLGTILQTPENAARKLRPIIGSLNAAQLESIKTFEAQGDAASAQGVVLDLLEKKIGGTAAAYGKTLPGQVAIADASLKEAKEQLVAGLAPGLELVSSLVVGLSHGFESLPGPVQSAAGGVLLLGGGFLVLARPVNDVLNLLGRFRTTSQDTVAATEALTAAQTANAAVTAETSTVMSAADAAALRRVVSNKALKFSDEEVALALQQRTAAELQAFVSNDALIAADAELAASEAAAAAGIEALAAASGAAAAEFSAAVAATTLTQRVLASGAASTVSNFASTAASQIGLVGTGLAGLAGPAGIAALGLGALLTVTGSLGSEDDKLTTAARSLTDALREQGNEAAGHVNQKVAELLTTASAFPHVFQDAHANLAPFIDSLKQGGEEFHVLARAGVANNEGMQGFIDKMHSGQLAANPFNNELLRLAESGHLTKDQWGQMMIALDDGTSSFSSATDGAKALTYAQQGAAAATNEDTSSTLTNADAQKALTDALRTQDSIRQGQLDSTRTLFDAQQSFTASEKNLETAQRGEADAARGVEDAQRRVADSYRGVEDAQRRVIDAQEALNKALQPADAETVGKAQDNLESANLRVADASQAVADAQGKVTQYQTDGKHTAADVAAAQRDVEKAQIALREAGYGVADAQQALNDAQAQGTAQDPAVVAATRAVDDAARGLEAANRGVSDALRGVDDANRRVAESQGAVNDAYLAEGVAAGTLKDAQDGLYGGTLNVNTAMLNLISSLRGVDALITPGSPDRQHLDDYIKNLFVLAGIFQTPAFTGPGKDVTPPGYVPTTPATGGPVAGDDVRKPNLASGGPLLPLQLFHGAERGPELLVTPGLYQAPDASSYVMNAHDTASVFADAGANTRPTILWSGDVVNPVPETASGSVAHQLAILADRMRLVG